MNKRLLLLLLLISGIVFASGYGYQLIQKSAENQSYGKKATGIKIDFLKKVDIGAGARPEIVVTADDMVFVVYLDVSVRGDARYSVRIYDDKNLNTEIAYKLLVSESAGNGKPTDIRVASDGEYLYAFYELVDREAHLWGAKYRLDANFERVAITSGAIATGPIFTQAGPGDELVNDPIALIGPSSVFAITRIKQVSFSKEVPMIYRVREFTYDLQTKLSEFDLDLSSVAGGQGRQASALYYNGYYYMVVPSTIESGNYFLSMTTPSDLVLVKLNRNWMIIESYLLSGDPNDVETFVTGFQVHNDYFFITYKRGYQKGSEWAFVSPLKVYDQSLNLVFFEIVKRATGKGESLRSSLAVTADRIYVGHSAGQGPPPPGFPGNNYSIGNIGTQTAEIYIYKWRESIKKIRKRR